MYTQGSAVTTDWLAEIGQGKVHLEVKSGMLVCYVRMRKSLEDSGENDSENLQHLRVCPIQNVYSREEQDACKFGGFDEIE